MRRILLVGEQLAHGGDPRLALYPDPPNSAGARLARILGLSPSEYLERFDRVNLCQDAWDENEARETARTIRATRPAGSGIVLLGRKAQRAFAYAPALLYVLALPHPSGLCREWNDKRSRERARTEVMYLAYLVGEGW